MQEGKGTWVGLRMSEVAVLKLAGTSWACLDLIASGCVSPT